MEELIEDYRRLKEACIETFQLRRTHPWPPTLTTQPAWRETYIGLAAELDFPTKDIAAAIARVQRLIDRTQSAEMPDGGA